MARRPLAIWSLRTLLGLALLSGCGGAAVAPKAEHPPAAAKATEPAPAAPVAEPKPSTATGPVESPGFKESMAALRPQAAETVLGALNAAPTDAHAYAMAALAYAETDVPAMTLIWGLTYQAMGGGKDDAAVAAALTKVLTERIIIVKPDSNSDRVNYNLRFAPGQMPARQDPDGSAHAPVAHVFEAMFGTTVMGYRPPWTIEQFYDVLSTWAGLISSKGTPLDETLELDPWLVQTAKAGHLEAYCHQLLGPAFPAELRAYKAANPTALKGLKSYYTASALKPTHAVMPDDLVRVQ